jgi:hypothetical protein
MPRDPQLPSPLGQRLRDLRGRWPGLTVRQRDIAVAFGTMTEGKQVPLSLTAISGWETGRETPTVERIHAYARFFASQRSMQNDDARLLADEELSGEEQNTLKTLETELLNLRHRQLQHSDEIEIENDDAEVEGPRGRVSTVALSRDTGRFWHFPDGQPIVIVSSKTLDPVLLSHPYANPLHPNHMPLMLLPDGLAVVELFGHLRA